MLRPADHALEDLQWSHPPFQAKMHKQIGLRRGHCMRPLQRARLATAAYLAAGERRGAFPASLSASWVPIKVPFGAPSTEWSPHIGETIFHLWRAT